MKLFGVVVEYINLTKKLIVAIGGIATFAWGGFVTVETFVVSKANTVVEPVKVKVETIEKYDKLLHESIEREIIIMRHYQEDNNKLLNEFKTVLKQ